MNIGRLDRQVTIQRRTETQDEFGQRTLNWTDVAKVWADIRTMSGRDQEQALAISSELTHTVAVRYRADLALPNNANTIRLFYRTPFGDRILNVSAVRDLDEDRRWLVFSCVEVTTDGVLD